MTVTLLGPAWFTFTFLHPGKEKLDLGLPFTLGEVELKDVHLPAVSTILLSGAKNSIGGKKLALG